MHTRVLGPTEEAFLYPGADLACCLQIRVLQDELEEAHSMISAQVLPTLSAVASRLCTTHISGYPPS